jgi:hypothetical protein
MMARPKLIHFRFDVKRCVLHCRCDRSGYSWYLIERGPFEQGKDRPIVWGREEETTYIVCPICRAINKINTRGMTIKGRKLDSSDCVVCSSCKTHFWFSLIGWVEKETRRFMRSNPGVCPFCKKQATPSRYGVTCFARKTYFHRDFYSCCGFYWPKSSSASAPIEKANHDNAP